MTIALNNLYWYLSRTENRVKQLLAGESMNIEVNRNEEKDEK